MPLMASTRSNPTRRLPLSLCQTNTAPITTGKLASLHRQESPAYNTQEWSMEVALHL